MLLEDLGVVYLAGLEHETNDETSAWRTGGQGGDIGGQNENKLTCKHCV